MTDRLETVSLFRMLALDENHEMEDEFMVPSGC